MLTIIVGLVELVRRKRYDPWECQTIKAPPQVTRNPGESTQFKEPELLFFRK